jgi:DNA-3-methyladenine glycosylase II
MKNEVIKHLSQDEIFKPLLEKIDFPAAVSRGDLYESLIRSIVGQQLSVKAAQTIHGRFIELFEDAYPHPDEVLSFQIPDLRAVGLSNSKANYIQNVAEFFKTEKLQNKDWSQMEDDEIIKYLTQIKGVGKWTVQMILMFTLDRPDIFPIDDLGIQHGIKGLYKLDESGKELKKKMVEIAETWRPYRTYASKYLWRWKDAVGI